MIKYEDECVGCVGLGLPCLGSACPNRNVAHYYCDKCEEEVETLYWFEGEQLCESCVLSNLELVEEE